MKTSQLLLAAVLSLSAIGAAHGFDLKKGLPKTEVVFFEPEKFTDVRDNVVGDSERARNEVLDELRTYIVKQANRLLAPGQTLKITVTDVDLAGEVEPWHANANDIRVVREIYPPSIVLAFKLTDAEGNVIAEGDRKLRDMDFMMKLSINRDDPRRYEKSMLDDWLHKDFGGLKK